MAPVDTRGCRCVSWSLGRTSALALVPSPIDACQQDGRNTENLRWGLELHEIGNQIQLAQMQTRSSLSVRSGGPHLCQQDEYQTAAVHLDARLNEWENGLSSDWQLRNLKMVVDRTSRAERYLFHLRYTTVLIPQDHQAPSILIPVSVVCSTLESSSLDPCSPASTRGNPTPSQHPPNPQA